MKYCPAGFRRGIISRRGITLIEMMILLFVLLAAMRGAMMGLSHAHDAGWGSLAALGCFVLGGILGGLAVILLLVILVLLYEFIAMIARILQPAELQCRCGERSHPVPEGLAPGTPLEEKVFQDSRCYPEGSPWVQPSGGFSREEIESRLIRGVLSPERIALAAHLGYTGAGALSSSAVRPILDMDNWPRMPEDVGAALRSGLPPRLCLAWAVECVGHLLPVFEREFHQDTRPGRIVGAAALVLRTENAEALELCRTLYRAGWDVRNAGCRVVRRSLKQRMLRIPSKGQRVARVASDLAWALCNYVEPSRLWAVYEAGSREDCYDNAASRCRWSQPCFRAAHLVCDTAPVYESPEEGWTWQRERLARMILEWERWDEDRAAWKDRVFGEWIPLVRRKVVRARFDIPVYIRQIRETLVPWEKGGGDMKDADSPSG